MNWADVVFDLDETLVSTRLAVYRAYREAGVDMPGDAWGKRWQEWCTAEVHDRKVELYPHFLRRHLRRLPCLDIALRHNCAIITSASCVSVGQLSAALGDAQLNVKLSNATPVAKAIFLEARLNQTGELTYVDDMDEARERLADYFRGRKKPCQIWSPDECLLSYSLAARTRA